MAALITFPSSGRINLGATARAYNVARSTMRNWHAAGAPLDQPERMPEWVNQWREDRQRVGKANARQNWIAANQPLMDAAVNLYTRHGMGLKAIRRQLGMKCVDTVKTLLVAARVYEFGRNTTTPEKFRETSQVKAAQAQEWLAETRRQCAACLRGMRSGMSVKTTCRINGWNFKHLWKHLSESRAYKALRERFRVQRGRPRRTCHLQLSRKYPKERDFAEAIAKTLEQSGIAFEREATVPGTRVRCDFLVGQTMIECKVSVEAGALNEALGQSLVYQTFTSNRAVILLPDDLPERIVWRRAAQTIGVEIIPERELPQFLHNRGCGTTRGETVAPHTPDQPPPGSSAGFRGEF